MNVDTLPNYSPDDMEGKAWTGSATDPIQNFLPSNTVPIAGPSCQNRFPIREASYCCDSRSQLN